MRALPNQGIEPTGGSRCAQVVLGATRRLPPVAHARRWAAVRMFRPRVAATLQHWKAFYDEA
jgi:hypothetical protein